MKTAFKIGIFAVSAVVLSGVAVTSKFIYRIQNPQKLPDGFTYTAHSGCENTEDNSMAHLKKCVELNVPVTEVDVTFRQDGTPVLFHGEAAADNEGILFEDAVKYLSENTTDMLFNLDLKAFNHIPAVVEILKKYGIDSRCFFTGVGVNETQTVKLDGAGIPYYLNFSPEMLKINNEDYILSIVNEVERSGAVGINCNYKYASQTLVEVFHENGYKVSLWTANSETAMKYLVSLGPDNITTRFPSVISKLV